MARSEDEEKVMATVTRYIPGPGLYMQTAITTVLTRGAVGDYAAYIGAGTSPEFVASFGDKLSFAEACAAFPCMALEEEHYRK